MRPRKPARFGVLTLLIVILGIGIVARVSGQAATRHIAPAMPCLAKAHGSRQCTVPARHPCCARWSPTTLTTEVDALIEAPRQPSLLFAGTSTGIWVSHGGRVWQRDRNWPAGLSVTSLTGSPASQNIFAGTGTGLVYTRVPGSPWTWHKISPSLGSNPVYSLAVNARTEVILAGTIGALFRGEPRGTHWHWQQVLGTGDASISAVAWVPSSRLQAFASIFGTRPAVVNTRDGGQSWQAQTSGLPVTLPAQALLPVGPGLRDMLLSTMGGGVWLWRGHGWRDVSAGLPEHHAMPLAKGTDGSIYAGTMGFGVYATTREAGPWHRLGLQLTGVPYTVLSLTVEHSTPPMLLAGTASGLYRYPLPG